MSFDSERFNLPYMQQVALGYKAGIEYIVKFGENGNVQTGPEDVWDGGGLYTGQPLTDSETVDVSSDDAADTAAGTGARSVEIQGLDENWEPQTETITLAGATLVTSVGTFRRVYRVKVQTAGSGATNAGTITCHHTTTTANVFAAVQPTTGQSRNGVFTVPVGRVAIMPTFDLALARANGAAGSGQTNLLAREANGVYRAVLHNETTTTSHWSWDFKGGVVFPEKTDLKWQATDVSNTGTHCSVIFEIILVAATELPTGLGVS